VTGKPDIQRLLQTAAEHQRAGRLADAEPILRRVLKSHPRNTDALYLLGLLTQATRRFDESADLFQRAVHENPRSAKYLVNLGLSLGGMGLGRTREATEALRAAVAIDLEIPAAWSNLGNEFRNDLKFEEAIDAYKRALRLKPDFADAHLNLGASLQETEPTLQPAIDSYEKAISLQPEFATAHWNLGFALLLSGDYPRGLAEYEWRLKVRSIAEPRNFPVPRWDGGDLAGKRILIHAEQGLGDAIHISRYIPMLAQRGGLVILECPKPLMSLLRGLPGLTQIFASGEPLPAFDVHCPIMSLPLMFKTTLATIPWTGPYLHADPKLIEQWSRRLPPDPNSPRIGLAWAGRPDNKIDHKRSMRLDQFALLSTKKNARFISLQKGPAAAQTRRPPGGLELIDYTNDLHDFADTAAMIANLDLILTVDTSVANLAGTLGRPTWLLLPRSPDWRWMLDREDSPWYPTLRLFRQKTRGDWGEVMERVKAELGRTRHA
jgi:Flp pilus assembly protein TadD